MTEAVFYEDEGDIDLVRRPGVSGHEVLLAPGSFAPTVGETVEVGVSFFDEADALFGTRTTVLPAPTEAEAPVVE